MRAVEEYLNRMSRLLACPRQEKQETLRQVEAMLRDIPGVEEMSMDELLQVIDPPEVVAEACQRDMEHKRLLRSLRVKNVLSILFFILAAVAVVLLAFFMANTWNATRGAWEESSAIEDTLPLPLPPRNSKMY